MPNQQNFRSDITNNPDPRYAASRIVRVPSEAVFLEEIPASFAFDKDDNIEIHFYTIPGNQLILSTVVNLNDGIVKSHVVSYNDGTYKNYLRIDFTKLFVDKNILLIPGDYRMVLNFFSNEIGNYSNRILNIIEISESRTEVELEFNNTENEIIYAENTYLLKEFVENSLNKTDAVGAAEKIFKSGVELNDPREGLTAGNVVSNITIPAANQTYSNTVGRIDRINLRKTFDENLNKFVADLFNFIREEIVINGDDRIQRDQYRKIIESVVKERMKSFRQMPDSRVTIK